MKVVLLLQGVKVQCIIPTCPSSDQPREAAQPYKARCEERKGPLCQQLLPLSWLHLELWCLPTGNITCSATFPCFSFTCPTLLEADNRGEESETSEGCEADNRGEESETVKGVRQTIGRGE